MTHNKINCWYLDWHSGMYVFDEMLEHLDNGIELRKFSILDFMNIGVNERHRLHQFVIEDLSKIFSKIKWSFLINRHRIDAFLVTHDWLPWQREFVKFLQTIGIPVILILHEGVFQNEDRYYEGNAPIADMALVWGELHKRIFQERGYRQDNIHVIGSIKLSGYKDFSPSIMRTEFFQLTNLAPYKNTITYCAQICDNQWGNQKYALKRQRKVISDLINIACTKDYNLVIRHSPSRPIKAIPPDFVAAHSLLPNVHFEGKDVGGVSSYSISASDNIFYSDLIVGMNTTMQLEASLLNRPAIIARYFDFDPKWNTELGLPIASNFTELENLIATHLSSKSLILTEKYEQFCCNYGFNSAPEFDPVKNIYDILTNNMPKRRMNIINAFLPDKKLCLPRWFGLFIANLIPNKKYRQRFRAKRVKAKTQK